MIEMLYRGGVLVIPIMACSILALAIFMERLIRMSGNSRSEREATGRVLAAVRSGKITDAKQMVAETHFPEGRVLQEAIAIMGRDRETVETVLAHAVSAEVSEKARYLGVLATISNITPMLGLLGTVIGMIKAFMVIQETGGQVNAAVLAGGIWEAMLTTALGLAVAMPTMLAYGYLAGRVEKFEARLREVCILLIKEI
jgi:biopolymer transport protein ExbB